MSPLKVFHKLRFFYWFISAYIKRHTIFIFLGLVIGIAFGLKIKDILPLMTTPIKEERIGVIGNYTQNSLPMEIQNLISSGLTGLDQNLRITPKIAQKITTLNLGKSYIFSLKKGIKWHDNKPFTAYDINYKFKDVSAKVLNPYTIRYELAESFSPFPSLVTQPLFKKGLIGLGENKVISLETEGKFISKLVLRGPKKRKILKFYPTEKDAITGYKLGEIKVIWGLNNFESLKSWKDIKIIPQVSEKKYVALLFNTRKGVLQEKSFRQALYYAIKSNGIKEKRAYGPIAPSSWAYNPNIKTYEYNLDAAQRLLAKAMKGNKTTPIHLKLTVLRPYEKYVNLITNSWEKIDIKTKVEVVTLPPANFEVLLAAQEIPSDPDQYLLWHSTSKLNITGYNNPRIDKLLEDGRQKIDPQERKEIYYDFQRFLVEDSPAIFLYYPTTYTITKL